MNIRLELRSMHRIGFRFDDKFILTREFPDNLYLPAVILDTTKDNGHWDVHWVNLRMLCNAYGCPLEKINHMSSQYGSCFVSGGAGNDNILFLYVAMTMHYEDAACKLKLMGILALVCRAWYSFILAMVGHSGDAYSQ